ncbi:MAG: hypothetical protein QM520_01185 [Gammaproteobacteria bacterium]|nr:hypothetical protein [Gammaproteobacteria bacterium]
MNSIIQPREVQKFEIINLEELKMKATNNQPPQKPSPPPFSRLIIENFKPPAKK